MIPRVFRWREGWGCKSGDYAHPRLPGLLSNMLSVFTPVTSQHSFLLKFVAPWNIALQGVGREREEREGEEKRRTTCAHARLICVGRGSAGVHQPSCIDIVSMGTHRWGRVGGGGGSTSVVRVVGNGAGCGGA